MCIVYIQMFVIDVYYLACVRVLVFGVCFVLLRWYGVIVWNFTVYINTRGATSAQRGTL